MRSGDSTEESTDSTRHNREGVRTALATPVRETRTAETSTGGNASGSHTKPHQPATRTRALRSVAPWAVAVSLLVVIGALVLMLEDTGRISAVANRPTPTPTPSPTPTALPTPTVTPLPSPQAGYKLYPDLRDGFYIQYPERWTITPYAGSVEFTDDPKSGTFDTWVIIPNGWSAPDQGANPDDPSAWVDYVLTKYYGGDRIPGTFTRTPGTQPPITVAGEQWQAGGGIFVSGQAKYRVEVYATIHDGKPFIINLAASDDQFDKGREQYFTPMLRSFTFLNNQNS